MTGATYEWQPGGSIIRNGNGTYKVRVQWPTSVGGGPTTVGVLITNHPQTCGGFILAYKDVYVVGSDLLSISPNPSSTSVNVSLQRNAVA